MKRFTVLVALTVLLAACNSGASADVATLDDQVDTSAEEPSSEELEADSEQVILAFAQCMRDNGVPNFPDPEMDSNGNLRLFGGGGSGELEVDQGTLQAAFEECSPLVEGLIQNFRNLDQSEFQDSFLEFAACMRDQGVDMPDPDFSSGFGPGAGGGRGLFGDIDSNDPAFQEAAEVCNEVFEGGFGQLRGGPGAGGNG